MDTEADIRLNPPFQEYIPSWYDGGCEYVPSWVKDVHNLEKTQTIKVPDGKESQQRGRGVAVFHEGLTGVSHD